MATAKQKKLASGLVSYFMEDRQQRLVKQTHNGLVSAISEHESLMAHVHSIRGRIKDPAHLHEKLLRKMTAADKAGEKFDICKDNLFEKINDLSGIRIIHLHTWQFQEIDHNLKQLLGELYFELREGPTAKTWDLEYEETFRKMGAVTEDSDRMYTSVHYIFASDSQMPVTCEIQVRTLMEEVWGEVDHTINYPTPTKSLPCREQILALARLTSSATRLVDSIFASQKDHDDGIMATKVNGTSSTKRKIKKMPAAKKKTK